MVYVEARAEALQGKTISEVDVRERGLNLRTSDGCNFKLRSKTARGDIEVEVEGGLAPSSLLIEDEDDTGYLKGHVEHAVFVSEVDYSVDSPRPVQVLELRFHGTHRASRLRLFEPDYKEEDSDLDAFAPPAVNKRNLFIFQRTPSLV